MQFLLALLGVLPRLIEMAGAWWQENGKQVQAWWTGRRGQRYRDEVESLSNTKDVTERVVEAREKRAELDRDQSGRFGSEWLRRGAPSRRKTTD